LGFVLTSCNRSLSTPPPQDYERPTLDARQETLQAEHILNAEQTAQALSAPTETPVPTATPEFPYRSFLPYVAVGPRETPSASLSSIPADVATDHPDFESITFVLDSGAVELKDKCENTVANGPSFCPDDHVFRREMFMSICNAIYNEEDLLDPTGTWDDIQLAKTNWGNWREGEPSENWYVARCAEQLLRDGYISGGSNTRNLAYPERKVRYQDYWVFFERGVHGGDLWEPSEATSIYSGCPACGPDCWYSKWCEAYINEGHYDTAQGPPHHKELITRIELAKVVEQYLLNQYNQTSE
jgi:hypothetical protein